MSTSVYDDIAEHFSATRYKPWRGVRAFLAGVAAGSTILEIGCGNGKNLGERTADCITHGCDPCAALIACAAAQQPHAELLVADGRALPYQAASMDVVMSIAVLHHLETIEERRKFLAEFVRVYRGSGGALITVWATTAVKSTWRAGPSTGDYYVPWVRQDGQTFDRFYHVFTKEEIFTLCSDFLPVKAVLEEADNWYVYA
jgi:tRNA (uracil-5-)-methyltransferase TRM9